MASRKRFRDETVADQADLTNGATADDSSSESDVGPSLPSTTPARKKRRVLPHEHLYVAALPDGRRYSRSLMHKDQLFSTTFTPHTSFLITASVDGQVSFWKKAGRDEHVDFVKEFKAHTGEVTGTAASWDGRQYASCGRDGTVKVWDVETFDLVSIIEDPCGEYTEGTDVKRKKIPSCLTWVPRSGSGVPMLAVANETDGSIAIWDGRGEARAPLFTVSGVHRKPVACMAYNSHSDCVISADTSGMLEYWTPTPSADKPSGVSFVTKSETNLFEFKKVKSVPSTIAISPTGKHFATLSFPDRKIRLFDFASGKLHRTYDESLSTLQSMRQAGTALVSLDDLEFGRRLASERDIETPATQKRLNLIFDETGHFLLYGSLEGIKVLNTHTNRCVRVYGAEEAFRPLNLALYQGQPDRKDLVTVEMAASENPLLKEAEARDAMLVTTGLGKIRFYMFTNETSPSKKSRDVQNEKPRDLAQSATNAQNGGEGAGKKQLPTQAIMHTTMGDIALRLFPNAAPLAVENFTTHAKNGYYNANLFHRVIKKFMIQTGDPLGDGTGGESIWGHEFKNEITSLKHEKYTLSMANAGEHTNASQFFVTTEECRWLDGKHTVFGRVTGGWDVVHRIEGVKVKDERPLEEVRVVNIEVL
ncbi:MAG: hypothetical protein Q9162_006005 [Coniocarpon cinnabarinum]